MSTLVETRNLVHAYAEAGAEKEVLHGINIQIEAGTNVFLTGYSGSGKTTLISLIGCLRSVQKGSLQLIGDELNGATSAKLLKMRRQLGYVFQHFNLLDFLTIRQNVQQSLEVQSDYSLGEARRHAESILDQVGLGDRVNAYPAELSGGQKQRVAVARALVHQPKLLIADEPTAALDMATGRDIIELICRLSKKQNSAAIIVTHNLRILDAADEILHMADGRLTTAVAEQISFVFPNLDDRHIAELASETACRLYDPNETIIRQGDVADEFFILSKGRVKIVLDNADGAPREVAQLSRRGAFFGEIGLLSDSARRQANVIASGDAPTEVLVINKATFARLCDVSRPTRAVIADEMMRRITSNS